MEESNTKRRTYNPADKERLLQLFLASGQSIKQWCHENQVALSTLQRWRKENKQEKTSATKQTWVPVALAPKTKASTITIKAGALSIAVSADTDYELLTKVLSAVNAVC